MFLIKDGNIKGIINFLLRSFKLYNYYLEINNIKESFIQGCHRRLFATIFSSRRLWRLFFNEKWLEKQLFLHKGDYFATFFFCISWSFDLKNTENSFRKNFSFAMPRENLSARRVTFSFFFS